MILSNDSVDAGVLENLREIMQEDDDIAPFIEILDLFVSDSPTHLHNIGKALEHTDPNQLKRAAHSLKGSCSNVGALKMAQICLQLEQMGAAGKTEGGAALYIDLQAEYERVRTVLGEVMRDLS
ncbi:MAG: Hpt domain-containing protein [Blastocatellia bacterium]|nr:Hpt domain-containing protein [Blastocatellia bacterium]